MTREELLQLAQDIVADKVFGSWMIAPEDMHCLERVFIPLQMSSGNLPEGVCSLYEYRDKSWPLKIYEYPVFFSMKFLTKSELVVLQELLTKLYTLQEELRTKIYDLSIATSNPLNEPPGFADKPELTQ